MVEFLTKEISQLAGIDEFVRAINNEADSDNFLLELNGFLREYGISSYQNESTSFYCRSFITGCPYSSLTEGNLNERLNRERDCSTLLGMRFLNYNRFSEIFMMRNERPFLFYFVLNVHPAELHKKKYD